MAGVGWADGGKISKMKGQSGGSGRGLPAKPECQPFELIECLERVWYLAVALENGIYTLSTSMPLLPSTFKMRALQPMPSPPFQEFGGKTVVLLWLSSSLCRPGLDAMSPSFSNNNSVGTVIRVKQGLNDLVIFKSDSPSLQ